MAKFVPIDAEGPRVTEVGHVNWHWLMPWACRACRRYGRIEVVLPRPAGTPTDGQAGTTDDELKEKVDRAHHYVSPFCVYGIRQVVRGRIYRLKGPFNQKIYLRAKGEREEDVKEQQWPPWES